MDCRPPGSSVHGILQARILEWVAISFSRESFWPRDQAPVSCLAGWVSCIEGRFLAIRATGKSLWATVFSLFKLWLWLLFFLLLPLKYELWFILSSLLFSLGDPIWYMLNLYLTTPKSFPLVQFPSQMSSVISIYSLFITVIRYSFFSMYFFFFFHPKFNIG